jgi:hypothetical protein
MEIVSQTVFDHFQQNMAYRFKNLEEQIIKLSNKLEDEIEVRNRYEADFTDLQGKYRLLLEVLNPLLHPLEQRKLKL